MCKAKLECYGRFIQRHIVILLRHCLINSHYIIIINLEKKCTTLIKKCLSSTNAVVNIISNIAIYNPMSTEGKNYRSVLDVTAWSV